MSEVAAWPDNPFWDFSLALYRRAGVAQACLALQERHGLDVNLILYFVWLGVERGVTLAETDVAAIVAHVAAWHDAVVRPLRASRTRMKIDAHGAPPDLAEALRARIKATELDAERIEQQMLYVTEWSNARGAQRDAASARATFLTYLKNGGIAADSATLADFEIILRAAQP